MTADEMIAVIQAHKEGKPIECREKIPEAVWHKDGHPSFDFVHIDYRIESEPRYRPFKDAEEVIEAIKEHGQLLMEGNEGCVYAITMFNNRYTWIGTLKDSKSHETMSKRFTFADGTPFGVKEG